MRRIRPAGTAIALAAVIPWLLGAYAVFFDSVQYAGLGIFESYLAFQGGSNLGNVIWFVVWSGTTGIVCWMLVRRFGRSFDARRVALFMLFADAVPSMLPIFPDTAMGFAVSHVRAFADDAVPHSPVAMFLIQSGTLARIFAVILSVVNWGSARKRRVPAS